MLTACLCHERRQGSAAPLRYLVLLVLALLLLPGAAALAQERPATATSASGQELRRQIERRYEVLPVSGGLLLTPRQSRRGVRTIEVTGDAVAINGEKLPTQTVRDWLGEDADPVLRLLAIDPGRRRALFGLQSDSGLPRASEETADAEETDEATADESPVPDAEDAADADETEVPEVTVEPAVPDTGDTPETPEAPETPEPSIHSGSRVKFGGSIVVEKDELAEEAVAIGGSVRVDGEVSRDAVAIGGPVRINGRIGGNVTSVGSSVHLGPNAVVDGDVTSVGGSIHRAEGSRILGSTSEVGMSPFRGRGPWDRDRDFEPGFGPFAIFGASLDVFGSLLKMMVLGLLTCLVLLLARAPLERVDRYLATEPWKSAGVGLAGVFSILPLLVVITILLVITVVGCALLLLYPFLFIALLLAFLLGYAAVAHRVGRWLEGRFGRNFGGPYMAALVGVFVIQIWSILGDLLALGPGAIDLFAFMFMLVGAVVEAAAWVVGFGAVLLARFGAGPRAVRPPAGMPPPPPYIPVVPVTPQTPEETGPALPLTERAWEEPPPER